MAAPNESVNHEIIEDDEFEEFENEEWAEDLGKDDAEVQWQEDWDDLDENDDFSKQLRAELEKGDSGSGK